MHVVTLTDTGAAVLSRIGSPVEGDFGGIEIRVCEDMPENAAIILSGNQCIYLLAEGKSDV